MSMHLHRDSMRIPFIRQQSLLAVTLLIAILLTAIGGLVPARTARAAGAIPAGLPNHFMLGLANNPGGITWIKESGSPWDVRYKYLSGGANTGGGWATWNSNGNFATYYLNDSRANGYITVFTYYQLLQSLPATGSREGDKVYSNLNNASTMQAYYADFRLLLDKIKAAGGPVVVHVEPDLFGFMQQRVTNTTNSAASIPASVAASGYPDAAGLPDTFQGFNQLLLRLRDRYAPNAILATHASSWAAGADIGSDSSTTLNVAGVAQKTAAFLNTAGITGNPSGLSSYDLVFFDPSDRDAGYYQYVHGDGGRHWWDETNQRFPNFARFDQYVAGVLQGTNRRGMLWQVPIGNTKYRSENNTDGHYQDNRVQYWLGGYGKPGDGHLQALANTGVIGILFGRGAGGSTTYEDAKRDGITNPAPINGNNLVAVHADDDGGYLRLVARRYYQLGALTLAADPIDPGRKLDKAVFIPLVRR